MAKKKAKWEEWLPSRPFKPEETIRDWDPVNINWDDETICALCGKSHECKCYDEYFCACGKKNKNCGWPDDVACPCKICEKLWRLCLCDKPDDMADEKWLEIKEILYYERYRWSEEIETPIELQVLDEEKEDE